MGHFHITSVTALDHGSCMHDLTIPFEGIKVKGGSRGQDSFLSIVHVLLSL